MIALRAHKQIANYPVRMQKLIAQYGFLECFDEKRCVVKQGHPPQAFYYIFYGSGQSMNEVDPLLSLLLIFIINSMGRSKHICWVQQNCNSKDILLNSIDFS